MQKVVTNILGWIGVGLILVGYGAVSFSLMPADSLVFQLINLIGAGCLIIETLKRQDFQPAVLNMIWALVAILSLLKIALS